MLTLAFVHCTIVLYRYSGAAVSKTGVGMSHIFISYSRKDLDYVSKIIDALAKKRLDVWIDREDIPKGEPWEKEIEQGIEEADAFLFLISPDSVNTRWCSDEIAHAVINGKRILPIVISETGREKIHPEINKRNWVFCRESKDDFDKAIEEIYKTIHTDYEWLKFQTELQVKALNWEQRKDISRLLRGKELREAEQQLADNEIQNDPQPTRVQQQYILASQRHEIQTRRQFITGLMIVLIIMIIISVFAWDQRNSAIDAQNTAIVEANARATAQKEAQEQSHIAISRQLVAQSKLVEIKAPVLAMLLSIQSVQRNPLSILSAEQQLRDLLRKSGGIPVARHISPIELLAFSPNGKWLASMDDKGYWIILQDMESKDDAGIKFENPISPFTNFIFSNDSSLLIAGSEGQILIWNLALLDQAPVVLSYPGFVRNIVISNDSRWLAASSGGDIALWDLSSPATAPVSLRCISISLTFDPNGIWLVSGDATGQIFLWDVSDFTAKPRTLYGHTKSVQFVKISPDGEWLASYTLDNRLLIWDMKALDKTPLEIISPYLSDAVFSPDGRWLVIDGLSKTEIINLDVDDKTSILVSDSEEIGSLVFDLENNMIIGGSGEGSIRIWDLNSVDSILFELQGHEQGITEIALSNRNWLASGGSDGVVRLWDMDELPAEPLILIGENYVTSLFFSPDGDWLIAGEDESIYLWDTTNEFVNPIVLTGSINTGWHLKISPNGRWLATLGEGYGIYVWDMNRLDQGPASLSGHEDVINTQEFSPDSKWLASGGCDGTTRLWNMRDFTSSPFILTDHRFCVETLKFSPDGRWLASIGIDDSIINLWDMNDKNAPPFVLNGHKDTANILEFSSDGRWLASGGMDDLVILWDIESAESPGTVLECHNSLVSALSFSSNGQWLASGSWDNNLCLWNLNSISTPPYILRGHEGDINSISFNGANSLLASASSDMTVRIWHLDQLTSEPIVLSGHSDEVQVLSFSSDGTLLVSGDDAGIVYVWQLNLGTLIDKACKWSGRNFTQLEWTQYFPGEEYSLTCPQWPAGE